MTPKGAGSNLESGIPPVDPTTPDVLARAEACVLRLSKRFHIDDPATILAALGLAPPPEPADGHVGWTHYKDGCREAFCVKAWKAHRNVARRSGGSA